MLSFEDTTNLDLPKSALERGGMRRMLNVLKFR